MSARAWRARKLGQWSAQVKAEREAATERQKSDATAAYHAKVQQLRALKP